MNKNKTLLVLFEGGQGNIKNIFACFSILDTGTKLAFCVFLFVILESAVSLKIFEPILLDLFKITRWNNETTVPSVIDIS